MADFISESGAQMQSVSHEETVKEVTEGNVFQEKNFAKDWNSIYVSPMDLDVRKVEKRMHKVTEPAIVLTSGKPAMACVLASEEHPVYFVDAYHKSTTYGYTLLFKVSPFVIPEYFFYMCKYNMWEKITADAFDPHGFAQCIGDYVEDNNCFVKPADCLGSRHAEPIPSLEIQKQHIEQAKAMESMIQEKMDAQTRKYEQKEWLNEAHIRNSKHRLSNEMMPIRMKVERLRDFFSKANGGVKLTDIIGKATGQTVDDLLNGLYDSVKNVEAEINNLTKSETAGEPEQVISVAEFLNDYCDKIATKYTRPFKIEKIGLDDTSRIKISPKLFIELLDNIVGNAVRHGFIENRDDYVLQVKLEIVGDKCKISIANNGAPMSERAQKEYFVRGSFAGTTGHTGIGGARVFEICDKAGGEAMQPYSEDAFPVVISVLFPLV